MLDIVGGDIGMSRHIAIALTVIADRTQDDNLRDQLREIVSGRGSIRDLVRNEGFMRIAETVVPPAVAQLDSLSAEERQRLVDRGNAVLEQYRDEIVDLPESDRETGRRSQRSDGTEGAVRNPNPMGIDPVDPTRDARTLPGTRKPDRDRVVGPEDDLDDDDVYFQERRRRGWLQ